jgi:D-alanyl-D-alanine carboxypeptidase/D-alanyl-D-alanine-endopeptidase (penicillin-binding protein 4)
MVLRTMGRMVMGNGSFQGGARAVRRFLVEEVGLPPEAVSQEDGSGLSAGNRASAHAFVTLLDHMARSELWTPYWESLPVAGNRRELGRMYRTAAAGNLRAKTGTIDGVSALTGMVQSAGGERILFSILANDVRSNSATKRAENRVGETLASLDRPFSPDPSRGRVLANWQPEGSEPGASPGVFFHEVQRGENFTVIARRYGVGLDLLMRANPGIRPTQLQAGQILEIPREGG